MNEDKIEPEDFGFSRDEVFWGREIINLKIDIDSFLVWLYLELSSIADSLNIELARKAFEFKQIYRVFKKDDGFIRIELEQSEIGECFHFIVYKLDFNIISVQGFIDNASDFCYEFDLIMKSIKSKYLDNIIEKIIVRGPTITVQQRFDYLKKIKEKHPDWTQERLAQFACEDLNKDNITKDTVRNAYRVMGEEWSRGKRTR